MKFKIFFDFASILSMLIQIKYFPKFSYIENNLISIMMQKFVIFEVNYRKLLTNNKLVPIRNLCTLIKYTNPSSCQLVAISYVQSITHHHQFLKSPKNIMFSHRMRMRLRCKCKPSSGS